MMKNYFENPPETNIIKNPTDVSKFFYNYNSLSVKRFTFIDNSLKGVIIINLFSNNVLSQVININNPDKNLNQKYIFNVLADHGIFLKSTISRSKVTSMKKELVQIIQILASNNHYTLPSKAGPYQELCKDNTGSTKPKVSMACYNLFPQFYPSSNINIDFNENANGMASIMPFKIQFNSFDGVFLLVLRYMSFMMPLSMTESFNNFKIVFPYIVTFSSQLSIDTVNNLLRQYLLIYTNPYTRIIPESIAINSPFNQLNNIIQNRTNNVLLINGIADTDAIRNENLNLLTDYFTQNCTDHLCCIISNTVQTKLADSSYINISFDEIENNTITNINTLDYFFIKWITGNPENPFFEQYNEIYNNVIKKYANNISNANAQQAISTLISVFNFIRKRFGISVKNCPFEDLENSFFNYLMPIFENHSKEENSFSVLKQFKSNINSMIYNKQLHVIPNDKTNKTQPYQPVNRLIYKGNGTIVITDEVMQYICQTSNINISSLKKSLVNEGYLSSSQSLNVSKISLYPPGSPSVRQYAYIIDDSIINKKLLASINRKQLFSLSFKLHSKDDNNGIILGYDINKVPVIWSYKKTATSHLMITGTSGFGKTTLILNLIKRILLKKEDRIVVFDISGSYINKELIKNICNIYHKKIPVNPFLKYRNENKTQYVNRICRNLNSCFNISVNLFSKLYEIIEKSFNEQTGLNTEILSEQIKNENNSSLTRIYNFIVSIKNNSGNLTWSELHKDKITVLRLDDSFEEYTITTEFLLRDMYDFRQSSADHTLFAVLDEIQNLVQKDSNAIIQILSQGREKKSALFFQHNHSKRFHQNSEVCFYKPVSAFFSSLNFHQMI